MSSLSLSRIPRLYQFALLAVLVVAALWFLVLRNMVSSSSSETPAPAVHTPTNVHRLAPPAAAAPGAHHAAAASAPATHAHAPATSPTHAPAGASAKHAATSAKSQSASTGAQHKPATATAAPAAAATHAAATTHAPAASTVNKAAPPAAGSTGVTGSTTPIVNTIDSQLAANQIVLVLFWQPGSTTDEFVHRELVAAGKLFGNHVALHDALASQVTEFGAYTQKALISETPTIMMITPAKAQTTLAGYTTSAQIAQAIEEAGGKRTSAPAPSHSASKPHK